MGSPDHPSPDPIWLLRQERDLSLALGRCTSLRDAMVLYLDSMLAISGMDCGGVYLARDDDSLELVCHRGLSPEFVAAVTTVAPDSASAALARQGRPIYLEDHPTRVGVEAHYLHEHLLSLAFLPIVGDGRLVACLNAASHTWRRISPFCRAALEGIASWMGGTVARLRALEERDRYQAELHRSQRLEALGRLAGGVAHDFNNLLGIILGETELSLRRVAADDPVHRSLLMIQDTGRRSAELTRQLLAFAHRQRTAPELMDLNATISSSIGMLERLVGDRISLVWRPGDVRGPILADPSQISQLLINLCTNARDAIRGTGTIDISTGQARVGVADCAKHSEPRPGEFTVLTVRDDGGGMSVETRAHLFEPFYTTKPAGQGTGLGLSTVWGIARQHGGFVDVESEPGLGSTFRVYLKDPDGR